MDKFQKEMDNPVTVQNFMILLLYLSPAPG